MSNDHGQLQAPQDYGINTGDTVRWQGNLYTVLNTRISSGANGKTMVEIASGHWVNARTVEKVS